MNTLFWFEGEDNSLNNRGFRIINHRITLQDFSCLILFLYLCIPLLRFIISKVFGIVGLSDFSLPFILICIAALYVFLCVERRQLLIPDFWVLLFATAVFFLFSYLLHPENEHWFIREDYGALNYVFRPDSGLYIYLIIRLINNPRKILRTVKLAGWPMYVYYFRQIMLAMARGYWIDTTNRGYEIHMSYNLSLGYSVLLFALAFLYCALEEKKLIDWIGALTGIGIILTGGSRGPFMDIAIFFVLYIAIKMSQSKKKVVTLFLTVIIGALLVIAYPYLVMGASRILDYFHLSSRFLDKLAQGTITEDSGRIEIWNAAWNMIRENPFGYGAFGSRAVISKYIYVAHPHQLFLEIMIDFGVFIGGAISVWLLTSSAKILRMRDIGEWKGVFLVFFARACQLILSMTFWHSIGLWGALAVGVNIYYYRKRGFVLNGR